jgi:N-glycosylase/DNA lyase
VRRASRNRGSEVQRSKPSAVHDGHFNRPDPVRELESAWMICADLFEGITQPPRVVRRSQVHREFLFCLLGGFGVSFELASSATDVIGKLTPFDPEWHEDRLRTRLAKELSKPQFHPECCDGRLRRYRFAERKADVIVQARRWLLRRDNLLHDLRGLESERDRRQLLAGCPGIGPKTASWLLRNLGLAFELAILDVHVMHALKAAGRITSEKLPRDYERVEAQFLKWCHELHAPPAAFDLFVWEWQRGSIGYSVV